MSAEDKIQNILNILSSQNELSSLDLNEDSQVVLGYFKSLAGRNVITYDTVEQIKWILTEEGEDIVTQGSHEVRVFNAVPSDGGITLPELQNAVGDLNVFKIGQSRAFKNKWLKKDGDKIVRLISSVEDSTREDLSKLKNGKSDQVTADNVKELKKRKLCDSKKEFIYIARKGPQFTLKLQKEATDITVENLAQLTLHDGKESGIQFKQYNFAAKGIPPFPRGHIHPLQKVRSEFRQIFFEMGFEEMPTNQYVESSFWNFDALFQPQDHPARDMHDTFFCSSPSKWDPSKAVNAQELEKYIQRVDQVHSKGGFGSTGYGTEWKRSEAETLLLRTHTTAVSSFMLHKLFLQNNFTPKKYFSIDKVFRNETVDATHLAEFHQVEGLIADYNLTLGDLIGFLEIFFKKLGLKNLKFKPTYNPYTEPSLEVFAYHPQLKKQIELGNSGMFRPEMLRPMIPIENKQAHEFLDKLPEDVRVIAWGLSLERPTMIKYGISNIRELVGHKVDLNMVYENSFCRLDKIVDVGGK